MRSRVLSSIEHITNLRFCVFSLAAVNFCLFIVGTIQCTRIFLYNQSQKGTKGAIEQMEKDIVAPAKKLEKKAEQKL